MIFDRKLVFLLSVAAIAQVAWGLPAQAQTNNSDTSVKLADKIAKLSDNVNQGASGSYLESPKQIRTAPMFAEAAVAESSEASVSPANTATSGTQESLQPAEKVGLDTATKPQQLEPTSTTPAPGTAATSAAPLTLESPAPEVAQVDVDVDVDPGQPTRGGSSYIGVAGNIGLGGDSALGEGAFVVISKIGFTPAISARPSVVIADDPVILVPVTYDFSIQPADAFEETFPVAPYIGGGIAIETSDDAEIGLLLTGGVDFPLSPQFTATAAVNAAFLSEADVGLLLGVGYNFGGFGGF